MLLTFFFAALAGAFASYAVICNRKWRKSKIEQKRLQKELAESKLECLAKKDLIKSLEDDLDGHKHLLTTGCRNPKVRIHLSANKIDDLQCAVSVVGCDTCRSDLFFVVKSFPYNANDPNDYDFAIRRAEELIETIQSI